MAKPQPKRIPSDDCAVKIDGAVCFPHEGEYVEMITTETVGEMKARRFLREVGVRIDAIKGEPDEKVKFEQIMDEYFDEICSHLAGRVFAWNWTDDWGRPLPQPDGTVGPLLRLRAGELYWLMNATGGETPAERKND